MDWRAFLGSAPTQESQLAALYAQMEKAPIGASRVGQVQPEAYAQRPGTFEPIARDLPVQFGVTQARAAEIDRTAMDVAMNFATVTPIRAFHGSPHRFDRFDMNRIGTGEGAQAYGHGLYFAGNEGVARSYRDGLSPPLVGGKSITEVGAPPLVARWWNSYANNPNPLRAALDDVDKALPKAEKDFQYIMRLPEKQRAALADDLAKTTEHLGALREARDWLRAYQDVPTASAGSMYEVALRTSPERLLDWDKPLSAQPAAARIARETNAPLTLGDGREVVGGGLWRYLDNQAAGAGQSSNAAVSRLREAGLDGIQYLDGGSRAAGEGSRNYVLFRDDIIDVVRRYGILGAMALGGAGAAGTAEAAK